MNSSSFSSSSPALPLTPSTSRFVSNGFPRPSSFSHPSSLELEEEIVSLEIEILRLERYILSLYRTALVEQLPTTPSTTSTPLKRSHCKTKSSSLPVPGVKQNPHELGYNEPSHPKDQLSISSSRSSSSSSIFSKETPVEEKTSYSSRHRSLADHLGAAPAVQDTICAPDRLSQEILRCISCVYCKLADAPPHAHGQSKHSPTPSVSLSAKFSFKSETPCWSPCKEELVSIKQLKGRRGASDLHADTIEILGIRAEGCDSISYATKMLQSLRSMVLKLEMIDPRSMRREEKLAFWINIHNALVMHAYLAYGTQNRANNRTVLKASYNVGGHCVDAYMIQSIILGIRPHVSAPRLQTLFSSGKNSKRSASTKHELALEYPEPLVHFAVCSGAYSDPVVRAYRGKDIFHQLQIAKEEYIRENVCIEKDRVILPKVFCYFAKDATLDVREIWGMVSKCVPEEGKKDFVNKSIHWSAPCSTFRFVIHRGLAKDG